MNEKLIRALMRCYVAMLESDDWSWRLRHQAELCAARDTLADATGIPSQQIQERCEEHAALRKLAPVSREAAVESVRP